MPFGVAEVAKLQAEMKSMEQIIIELNKDNARLTKELKQAAGSRQGAGQPLPHHSGAVCLIGLPCFIRSFIRAEQTMYVENRALKQEIEDLKVGPESCSSSRCRHLTPPLCCAVLLVLRTR